MRGDIYFEAADWMARLKKISQDVRIAKGPANDAIGWTSKEIENELINRFDAAGAKEVPDHRTMKVPHRNILCYQKGFICRES